MSEPEIAVARGDTLTNSERRAITDLCSRAYGEDFAPYLALLHEPTHVLARMGDSIFSHACWVTRWLQAGDGPLLRTAYVEAVATEPAAQGRGLATAVLRRLASAVIGYDLAALAPSEPGFYARLGWELWRGPLSTRTAAAVQPTEDELVMILRLPNGPPLNLDAPLSVEWREGEVW